MQDTDEEWVTPMPIRVAITEALATAKDLDESDLQEIGLDHSRLILPAVILRTARA